MSGHLAPVGTAVTKTQEQQVLARRWRKGTVVHCRRECSLVRPLWKTVRRSSRGKNRPNVFSSDPTSGSVSRAGNTNSAGCLHPRVHSSAGYSNQDVGKIALGTEVRIMQ